MAPDMFDRLAELEVPPPPVQFDTQLHERVNRSLLIAQFVDLAVKGVPWALVQFLRATVGALVFTITGRYETSSKNGHRKNGGTKP
jgi:hypothetical protein